MNNRWMNAIMKVSALKNFASRFNAHFTNGGVSRKTFIWLPFTGGISAFAVILPKPRE
jgi:hypothetical protein